MASLIFPDINVWLAILLADHVHREAVKGWWTHDQSETIAFVRFTQLGVLRLLTTAAVMNGLPLGMAQAWAGYDRLFADDRVAFVNEPRGLESHFRQHTQHTQSSSKLWADAWLLAFAEHSACVGTRCASSGGRARRRREGENVPFDGFSSDVLASDV